MNSVPILSLSCTLTFQEEVIKSPVCFSIYWFQLWPSCWFSILYSDLSLPLHGFHLLLTSFITCCKLITTSVVQFFCCCCQPLPSVYIFFFNYFIRLFLIFSAGTWLNMSVIFAHSSACFGSGNFSLNLKHLGLLFSFLLLHHKCRFSF